MRRLGMVLLAILFLFMVFAGPAAPKANAVVVSTVVIGAVIAAMAAAGIGLTVSGMTSAQLSDWVGGKLNDWATSLGGSVQDHIDNNLITVTARGILSVGNAAAAGIADFITWLKGEQSLTDNQTVSVISIPGVLLIDQSYYIPVGTNRQTYYYSALTTGTPYYTVFYTNSSNDIMLLLAARTATTFKVAMKQGSYVSPDFTGSSVSSVMYQSNSTYNLQYYVYGTGYYGYVNDISGNTGAYTSFNEALSAINDAINNGNESKSLEIETGVITIPTIATGDKWFLDVGADPGVTVETATDGVIADTIDGTLTVSGEVAEEEPPFEVTGPIGISGLTEVFPFCIPFDVYDLLSCLSADPQTPIFTVRFVIPGIINEEFTIDLTPFNAVAQIVRTMELIAFAIGLALVTRERFLRS